MKSRDNKIGQISNDRREDTALQASFATSNLEACRMLFWGRSSLRNLSGLPDTAADVRFIPETCSSPGAEWDAGHPSGIQYNNRPAMRAFVRGRPSFEGGEALARDPGYVKADRCGRVNYHDQLDMPMDLNHGLSRAASC